MEDNRGFFLAEILLSLSALLIILTVLVPFVAAFIEKRDEQKLTYYANNILYEQLLSYKVEGTPISGHTIRHHNHEFVIVEQLKKGRMEVCVHYGNEQKVCDFVY